MFTYKVLIGGPVLRYGYVLTTETNVKEKKTIALMLHKHIVIIIPVICDIIITRVITSSLLNPCSSKDAKSTIEKRFQNYSMMKTEN